MCIRDRVCRAKWVMEEADGSPIKTWVVQNGAVIIITSIDYILSYIKLNRTSQLFYLSWKWYCLWLWHGTQNSQISESECDLPQRTKKKNKVRRDTELNLTIPVWPNLFGFVDVRVVHWPAKQERRLEPSEMTRLRRGKNVLGWIAWAK